MTVQDHTTTPTEITSTPAKTTSPEIPAWAQPTPSVEPRAQRRRLNELLKEVPETELFLMVDGYVEQMLRGTVRALPLKDERFTLSYLGADGKAVRKTLTDEGVEESRSWQTWFGKQREASQLALLRVVGRVETTLARLKSRADNFDTLLEIRCHCMKVAGQKKGAPTPAARTGKRVPQKTAQPEIATAK